MNEQRHLSEFVVAPITTESAPGDGPERLARLVGVEARGLVADGVDPATIDAVLVGSAGFDRGPFSGGEQPDGRDVAAEATRRPPLEVVDHGAEELQDLLRTSTIPVLESNEPHGVVELPHSGILVSTEGPTAVELGLKWGPHVVVIDRMLQHASAVAMAAHPACDPRVLDSAVGLVQAAGIAVHLVPDVPGLVAARILATLRNASLEIVHRTATSESDLDALFQVAAAHSVGLATWANTCGPRTLVDILGSLHAWYGAERYRPSPSLRRAHLLARTPAAPTW